MKKKSGTRKGVVCHKRKLKVKRPVMDVLPEPSSGHKSSNIDEFDDDYRVERDPDSIED